MGTEVTLVARHLPVDKKVLYLLSAGEPQRLQAVPGPPRPDKEARLGGHGGDDRLRQAASGESRQASHLLQFLAFGAQPPPGLRQIDNAGHWKGARIEGRGGAKAPPPYSEAGGAALKCKTRSAEESFTLQPDA